MKLSIIVPVYKVEPYLRRCVDSILAQTFTDFELILVDDGSPDGCPAICDEYAEKDSRVKVIHKGNGGLSDARNAGLDVAQGEYIGFVDSDDLIKPDMYSNLIKLARETRADIVVCGIEVIDEDGNKEMNWPETLVSGVYSSDELINNFSYISSQIMPSVANKIFARKIFAELRFPKGKLYEDGFIQIDLYKLCNLVAVDEYYGYCYQNIRKGSITNSSFSPRNFDWIELKEHNLRFFIKNKIDMQIGFAVEEYVNTYLRQYFLVYSRYEELKQRFNAYMLKFVQVVPQIIKRGHLCRMKKIMVLLSLCSWRVAYMICKRLFPECIDPIMR